ncbi:MAG: hypothetical protein Q8942_13195 [Bacillota bacterium]|nr:hypothetical protein [Bacillota bacterium]
MCKLEEVGYSVRKKSQLRLIAAFSNDPSQLKEYLGKFSEH